MRRQTRPRPWVGQNPQLASIVSECIPAEFGLTLPAMPTPTPSPLDLLSCLVVKGRLGVAALSAAQLSAASVWVRAGLS